MKYELSFIISPLVPETEHESLKQEILGYLKDSKAEIISEPYFMGRKKLTYPIKKQKHGFYVFLEFSLEEKQALKDLDVKLRHNNNILRHLIIKKDKVSDKSKVDMSKFADVPEGKVFRKTRSEKPRRSEYKPREFKKPVKTEEIKVDLKDIDKQLDEILEAGPKID